jgi:hypothetical protein
LQVVKLCESAWQLRNLCSAPHRLERLEQLLRGSFGLLHGPPLSLKFSRAQIAE